jgi:hypothetical protein
MLRIGFDTGIFLGKFNYGRVFATADVLISSAGSHRRAMDPEHVPDAWKDRQHLDSSFQFGAEGRCPFCFTLLRDP